MSEQVHCWIDSPATATGPRSMSRAFVISLFVHAAVLGVLWHFVSTQQPAPRELRVELSLSASSIAAVTTAHVTAEPKVDSTPRKIKARPDPLPRVRGSIAQPAAFSPGLADTASSNSESSVPETQAPARAQAQEPTTLPIDLRVLDWLARYRTYPLAARRARIEGVVQLRVTLMPDGRLIDARVEQSSGHALLDRAALELLARAARLPDAFGSERTEQIELQLPIVYRMRT
jgi:protein TonB